MSNQIGEKDLEAYSRAINEPMVIFKTVKKYTGGFTEINGKLELVVNE